MNIVVLCGGLSNERDVSISSGTGVARALREKGHNAVLIDLYLGYTEPFDDPAEVFARGGNIADFSVAEAAPDLEAVRAMGGAHSIGPNVLKICEYADISFLALHGEEGENGKLQATFDLHGIKYTGSGYLGSALAMNKSLTKTVLASKGIPVPTGITVEKGAERYENVGFPCVVKPCSGGSSVGTSIVYEEKDYLTALELAFKYEKAVLVEKYISGRELTVGVMNGKAMPAIEIIPKCGFYDYKNKYQAGATEEICPAPIGEEATEKLQRLAERVHEALMIDAYCRVDFLWNSADGEMYCLEANTLPGMTPTSLIPQMAREIGLDYGSLCEKIIEVSMEKYR